MQIINKEINDLLIMAHLIKSYQKNFKNHSLICNHIKHHEGLKPKIISIKGNLNQLILACENCDYIQKDIPESIFDFQLEKEYKIEILMSPHFWDNFEKPYFWCILVSQNDNWINIGYCGWAKTTTDAWEQANKSYRENILNQTKK